MSAKKTPVIFGIKNCDTMKKTFNWFQENGIEYIFHDYKTEGITAAQVKLFMSEIPLSKLINAKGTSFRALTDEEKERCKTKTKATPLLVQKPTLMKRPVIAVDNQFLIGFEPELWEKIL